MHSTPYYPKHPIKSKARRNSFKHPKLGPNSPFYVYPKEKSRLLLVLGLILVDLEVSQRVGVFGGSDDSVLLASFLLLYPSSSSYLLPSLSTQENDMSSLNRFDSRERDVKGRE
jgi:hypothetical protein